MSLFTEKERLRKLKLFKGTIAVCAVYGVLAFLLLGVIYFTERGKEFVEQSNFPFAITFTIGMLIVIVILSYKINKFKENLPSEPQYDDTTCPDYWRLVKANNPDNTDPSMGYTCVKDNAPSDDTYTRVTFGSNEIYKTKMQEAARTMYGVGADKVPLRNGNPGTDPVGADQISLKCGKMFPIYMSNFDVKNYPDNQNTIRCAYASKCGLSWSSVCQNSV